jgi:hypothetical protein
MVVMGFPPHHRFPPMEPEAPVSPPVAGASLCLGVTRMPFLLMYLRRTSCHSSFGWEAPVQTIHLAGAFFRAAETCLSILVSAVSTRLTVCGSRKRQRTRRRGKYGLTLPERG